MVSLLIGSGFSAPDKVPLVGDIDNFLLNLKYEDIYIHSSQSLLLNCKPSIRLEEHHEKFIVDLIQFYSSNYDFDYEDLFDYAYSYYRGKENKEEIEGFFDTFYQRHSCDRRLISDSYDMFVRRFIESYSQLITRKLSNEKYCRDISYGNYPPYDAFFSFLDKVSNNEEVHIHSLNHDLLFEHLASSLSSLFQKFTDGYEEMGSPYYGEVCTQLPVKYHIRLRKFTNTFDKPIRLYKLHGSIDTYIFGSQSIRSERVKTKYGVGRFLVELFDSETNSFYYEESFSDIVPDFLTGRVAKTTRYSDNYYATLFNHFKKNLHGSRALVIIGYGFKDKIINELVIENYDLKHKPLVIVDIKKPELPDDLRSNSQFICSSVTDVAYDDDIVPVL